MVSNIQVKLPTILEVGGTITNLKLEKLKAESGNMENVKQKFLQSHYLQPDRKRFLKDVEVRLTDKTQGSGPTKREFYWTRENSQNFVS